MKKFKHFLAGLLIVAASLTAGWFVVSYLWSFISFVFAGAKTLEAGTYVPLALTLFTGLLGLFVTLWTQSRARKRSIEEAHRNKKVELYYSLLSLLKDIMLATKEEFADRRVDQNELVLRMAEYRTEMTLWASPKVLLAFYGLTHTRPEEANPKNLLVKIDPLYKAMRQDIGLSNFGLPNNFFAKSILADPTEFDRL